VPRRELIPAKYNYFKSSKGGAQAPAEVAILQPKGARRRLPKKNLVIWTLVY